MHNQRPVSTRKLFTAEAIVASADTTSVVIDLREITGNGFFSLHYITTGTGTTKFEYLVCSTVDGTYLDVGTDIGAALAAGSDLLSFSPEVAPFMKIKATEPYSRGNCAKYRVHTGP